MITMALPVDPASGRNLDLICPVIVCDVCESIINADVPGILLYDGDDFSLQFHVHKGRCDRLLESVHHASNDKGFRRCLWEDLDTWISHVARNYTDPLTRPRDVTLFSGSTVHVTRWTTRTGRDAS